jgi:peptidoglycan hydrolase CwlO-like protein
MTKYIIEAMTERNFFEYSTGSNEYNVESFIIEAETAEEAISAVNKEHPELVVNTNYVVTIEEKLAREQANKEALENAKKEAAKKQEAKELKTAEKAESMGLTVERYKELKKRQAKVTRYKREIAQYEATITELEKEIESRKKWLEKNA